MSISDVMVPRKTPRKDSAAIKDQDCCISDLPDEVINLILTSNLSTAEAVATCVLSKDWKYKWESIYDILINDQTLPVPTDESTLNSFLESLKTLILHRREVRSASLKLKREYEAGAVQTLLSDLLDRNNVEKLHIETTQKLTLPDSLFSSASLKELVLIKGPLFHVTSKDCFLNLTTLCLRDIVITNAVPNEYLELFVFNFPVLENLEVFRCMWCAYGVWPHAFMEIHAPALKTFKSETLPDIDELQYTTIIIHGAKLELFLIKGGPPEIFTLTGSEVVCANLQCVIDLYAYNGGEIYQSGVHIRSLLNDIAPSLEKLYVSEYVAQAILDAKQGISAIPFTRFEKLRTLSVKGGIHLSMTGAVFEILHATPFLACLNIDAMFWDEYDYEPVESVPECITNSLEEINLSNVMGTAGTFQLAKFLLKTAAKLKAFHVDSSCDSGIPLEEAKAIISGYPTASTSVTFTWCSS